MMRASQERIWCPGQRKSGWGCFRGRALPMLDVAFTHANALPPHRGSAGICFWLGETAAGTCGGYVGVRCSGNRELAFRVNP